MRFLSIARLRLLQGLLLLFGAIRFGPVRTWYLWRQMDMETERFLSINERDITLEEAARLIDRVHWFEVAHKRSPSQDEIDYLIHQLAIR